MPFSGSGTYSAPAGSWNPAVTATAINSTDWNALLADLTTALSTCVLKDGTQTPTANIPMGGFKLTGMAAGTAYNDSIRMGQSPDVCEFRLTLTTGVPVTTADVTGGGTLFCTPYKGNRISLYNGSTGWVTYTSAEFSLALTLTSGKPYDIFCFASGTTPTLESLVWTNDTTRATALTLQDGVYVKTGATTRRYMGTIYASGANTTEDSLLKRYVFNAARASRALRPMLAVESANSWTYSTATYRQMAGSTTNMLDYVQGLSEDAVWAMETVSAINSTATVRQVFPGIGVDSTTVQSAGIIPAMVINSTQILSGMSIYRGFPGVGRHTLVPLESGAGSDTQTWYGDNNTPGAVGNGISGEVWA